MFRILSVLVIGLICNVVMPLAQTSSRSDDRLIGSWAGTFEGDSSGTFTMSIRRDEAKNLGGTLEVMFEVGEGYSATFRTIDVDGNTVTLAYDTPGEGAKVQLDGALDGKTLKGAWKASDPGTNSVASSGSFTISKQ